jgi:hypothetical protein
MSPAGLLAAGIRGDIPLDPDAPHARDLLLNELRNPAYQAAKPTWLDLASQAVRDWLASLFTQSDGVGGTLAIIGLVVVLCLVVGAVIIFGVPRLNRRRPGERRLLDTDDERTADQLRRSAQAAAQAGEWTRATAEMFRAAARGLAERTIISVNPGTTAHDVAQRAGAAFPELRDRLADGARTFDGVRYLAQTGTAHDYERIRELDAQLRAAQPVSLASPRLTHAGSGIE